MNRAYIDTSIVPRFPDVLQTDIKNIGNCEGPYISGLIEVYRDHFRGPGP